MSQFDVSQRIKLQVRQVAALEDGNWDLLPGRAFARGALRSYGKLIQADVAPLLEVIGTTDATAQMPRHALSSGVGPATDSVYERQGRSGTLLWVIGGLVAAGALIFHFGSGPGGMFDREAGAASAAFSTESSTGSSAAVASTSPAGVGSPASASGSAPAHAPAVASGTVTANVTGGVAGGPAAGPVAGPGPGAESSSAPAAPSATAGAAATAAAMPTASATPVASAAPAGSAVTVASGAAGAVSANAAASADNPPAATMAAPAAPVAAKPGSIVLQPVEDSWVRVTDASGRKIHEALIPAGATVTVEGKPPYKLRMGNARHLKIRYEGRDVRVPPPNEKNITLLELQ